MFLIKHQALEYPFKAPTVAAEENGMKTINYQCMPYFV